MRTPTSPEAALAWHAAALAARTDWQRKNLTPVGVNEDPQAGWFKRRLIKNGPWVPARIWLDQEVEDGELLAPERVLCEVDGQRRDALDQWLWLCQEPISEREFIYLTRLRAWQRVNAPEELERVGRVDHTETPIVEES